MTCSYCSETKNASYYKDSLPLIESHLQYGCCVFCQLLEESEQDTDSYSKESLPQYTDRGVPIARVEDYVTDRDTHSTDSVSLQLFTLYQVNFSALHLVTTPVHLVISADADGQIFSR